MLFSLAITTLSHYTATHAEGSLCVSLCGVTHSFEQHHISCISSFVLRRTLLTPLPVKQQNVSPDEIHQYTAGTARMIDKVCTSVLLYGSQSHLRLIDDRTVKLVLECEFS